MSSTVTVFIVHNSRESWKRAIEVDTVLLFRELTLLVAPRNFFGKNQFSIFTGMEKGLLLSKDSKTEISHDNLK